MLLRRTLDESKKVLVAEVGVIAVASHPRHVIQDLDVASDDVRDVLIDHIAIPVKAALTNREFQSRLRSCFRSCNQLLHIRFSLVRTTYL